MNQNLSLGRKERMLVKIFNAEKKLYLLLLAPLTVSIGLFLYGFISVFTKPYELVGQESLLWNLADRISKGNTIYHTLSRTSYEIVTQSPLFPFVVGELSKVLGSSMALGRLVSLLSGLGICLLVYLVTKKLTSNKWIALISALLVVTVPAFRFVVPIERMDSMGAMLSLLGIYLFMRWERSRLVVLSAIPLVLAVFAKQYFIAAPIAVCGYCLLNKELLKLLKVGGSIVLLGLVGVLVLNGVTGGQFLAWNVFLPSSSSALPLLSWTWTGTTKIIFLGIWPVLLVPTAYLIYKVVRRQKLLLVDIYFLVAGVLLVWIEGGLGGSPHYALEVGAVGSILIGILLSKVVPLITKGNLVSTAVVGVTVLLVFSQILGPLGSNFKWYSFIEGTPKVQAQVIDFLRTFPGLTYCDSVGYQMLAGVPYEPIDLISMSIGGLFDSNSDWDSSVLVERFNDGYYSRLVLGMNIGEWEALPAADGRHQMIVNYYPAQFREAVDTHYKVVCTTDLFGTNWQSNQLTLYEYVK